MTKRLLVIAIGVMSTLLGLAALWQFRIVVIYVLISLLVAAAFRPAARNRSLRYKSTRTRLILGYLGSVSAFVFLVFIAGRFLANDFQQLVESLTEESNWLLPAWLEGTSLQQTLSRWLPTPSELLQAFTSEGDLMLSALLGITEGLGGIISGLVVIIFLSIYWSINQSHFERLWLSLLPADVRKPARHISRTIEYELGAYTRSELIQSVLAVVLLGLGYYFLGSPYATLLAVMGALARLLPVVGSTLAFVLPFILGSLTSTQLGVSTVLYTAVVLVFLQVWVEPRFFKPTKDNPVLTLVILLAMADAFGLLGIVAAPPLSVICQTIWRSLVTDRITPDTGSQVLDLKERHARLQTTIQEMVGSPPQLITSSMERLTELIEKAEPILDGKQQQETPNVLRAP